MTLVQFSECNPDFEVRYCKDCKKIVKLDEFEENSRCPFCSKSYFDCEPIWSINFLINEEKYQSDNKLLRAEARGAVLDPVIGLTIKDFLYIAEKIQTVDWFELLKYYFVNFSFLITRDSYVRIKKINLTEGGNLTFRQWITTRTEDVNVDQETITSTILERYLNEDDDDENEPFN